MQVRRIGLSAFILVLAACASPSTEDNAAAEPEIVGQESNEEASPDSESEPLANVLTTEADRPSANVHPCLVQGSEKLEVEPIRAVGTEPFWGARVQGRCVTYSTPENQQGTRVWTRYSQVAGARRWVGQLDGKSFELVARPEAGCSDGMSDERYPLGVELQVSGELRRGCAEPLK